VATRASVALFSHFARGENSLLDFRRFDVITFDCYGTLIDWETGLLDALRPLRAAAHLRASDDEVLEAYALLESTLESGDYLRYRDVLRSVMRGLAQRFAAPAGQVDLDALANSLPRWPPFADTVESLARLKKHKKLGIISNTDDDLFAETARALQVPFDFVNTAEQVGSYKPSPRNFERALEVMGIPRGRVLHAAQSRFHDIAPARALGISCVWVNRRHDKPGEGATAVSTAEPDLEVPDLKTLADLVEARA
jgi:2-haloacid dehalogenase